VISYKDALKWVTVDLNLSEPLISKWVVRTKESLMMSERDSLASGGSVFSGITDLSDVSGITDLKNQLVTKEKLLTINENPEIITNPKVEIKKIMPERSSNTKAIPTIT
jgi:hypothetical protein